MYASRLTGVCLNKLIRIDNPPPKNHGVMHVKLNDALEDVTSAGANLYRSLTSCCEEVDVLDSAGRVIKDDLFSPCSTPPFDSSAMDGFAVMSKFISSACDDKPIMLRVVGMQAAGDRCSTFSSLTDKYGVAPCVEIMTGAQFPISAEPENEFDACVPVEHIELHSGPEKGMRYILLRKPVLYSAHRRYAGRDFEANQLVLSKGTRIEAKHIMAMASLGLEKILVSRRVRIGIWSTGNELGREISDTTIRDANGPYLLAALRSAGMQAQLLGILPDDLTDITSKISQTVDAGYYDCLITTGAVSAGRFDFVRNSLESAGAKIHFHHVAMRPGHPVLFASRPSQKQQELDGDLNISQNQEKSVYFFGLPGNPGAAAACLTFIVMPFLRTATGQNAEMPLHAVLVSSHAIQRGNGCKSSSSTSTEGILQLDVFRHGYLTSNQAGPRVEVHVDQSPGKIRPFAQANCWIHFPRGMTEARHGDVVACYPITPGCSIF